jgi:hypothetical protein
VFVPVEPHESVVQVLPSLHVMVAPATHVPDEHASFCVHPLPSALHDVPFALLDHVVTLVVALVHC